MEMESTVNQYLGELLKQFSGGINTIGDFAREQIPDIIQQFVMYHLVIDIVTVLGIIILVPTTAWIIKKVTSKTTNTVRKAEKEYSEGVSWTRWNNNPDNSATSHRYDFITHFYPVFNVIEWTLFILLVGCIVTPAFIHNGIELVKIFIAPKIWLIEQAVELGRSVSGH